MKNRIASFFFYAFNLFIFASSHSETPKVSIITSVYKGDEFIKGFLDDIIQQSIFPQCELIIINANSPDHEEPVIKDYCNRYPNIIYERLDHDPGIYAVWNLAIKNAHGTYITNANIDDRRNPSSLEEQVKALDGNPDIDLVYSNYQVSLIPNEAFTNKSKHLIINPPEFNPAIMFMCLPGPQPMWRKSVHERFGYFDETFFSTGDLEFWNRISSQGARFKKIPGISGFFYYNPSGLSNSNGPKSKQVEQENNRIKEKYYHCWSTLLNNQLYHWLPFNEAMSSHQGYNKMLPEVDWRWKITKDLYDKFVNALNLGTLRIPKKMHHIWLGSPFPEKYQKLRQTFIDLHPDWEFYLWTEKEIDEFGLQNRAMYNATTNYGEKSDIARYEILYRLGGVYVDTDFQCLKSFTILNFCCDFYTGFVGDSYVTLQNGLIGSIPGHPILKYCIENMKRNPWEGDTFREVLFRTGPVLFENGFLQCAGKNNLIDVALPPNYFYPWPSDGAAYSEERVKGLIKPESFAVHLWHIAWNNGKAG